MATRGSSLRRWVCCFALAAVLLPGFVGTSSSSTNAAPVELRAYTWTLSAEDFEAGEFTQTVFEAGQLQLARAERGSYVTAAHRAPFPFIAVGAEWRASLSAGATFELALRLSRDGHTWGDWQPLYGELQGERWFGENLVTLEDAQWMQARLTLRGAARVEGLTLTAIAVSGAPTLEQARAQARLLASTGAPPPYIIPRAAWGADESLMTWPPEYAPAKKLILHHTVTSGGNDPIAEIQAIYYYHAVVRGWGDIGYNYLVDKAGNIYEGRAGGLDVIGAHTLGYNAGSVGIGNLGNYSSNVPTSAMRDANAALAAWYGSRSYLHPLEESLFNDRVTPNIGGHRDYDATACPGDAFYAQLPAIRTAAWALLSRYTSPYAAAYLGDTTPSRMLSGSTVEVSHTLRNVGTRTWYHLADPGFGTPYHLGYHWYDEAGDQYVQPPAEDHRTPLLTDIPYGALTTFPSALLTAPHTPGEYTLKWDMVHEGVTWFAAYGSPTLDVNITVTEPVTITGFIRDNRGAAVPGAQATVMAGTLATTDASGYYSFTALFPGAYALQAYEPAPFTLPNGDPAYLPLSGGETASVTLVLAPGDDVIRNGGFEAGLEHWTVTLPVTGTYARASDQAHTGHGAVELRALQGRRVELQQVTRLPAAVVSPTLSLRFTAPAADPGDVLRLLVGTPAGVVSRTLPYGAGWQHGWTGVAAASGETVTVTVRLEADADALPTTVFLDEITLGSGGAYGWRHQRVYLPLALREHSETPSSPACEELLINGDFETREGWEILPTVYHAAYVTAPAHAGSWALRAGIVEPQANVYSYSSFQQSFTVPANAVSADLSAWLYSVSTAPESDLQYLLLLDAGGAVLKTLWHNRDDARDWQPFTFDLLPYAGQTVTLRFGAYNDGEDGVTALFVDDVSVQACHEAGELVFLDTAAAPPAFHLVSRSTPSDTLVLPAPGVDPLSVQLAGGHLYYWSWTTNHVMRLLPSETPVALPLPAPGGAYPAFSVRPDGSQLTWSIAEDLGEALLSRLYLADGLVLNPRLLVTRTYSYAAGPRYLDPFAWSSDGRTLYAAQMYAGIGGYILFPWKPYALAIDTATGVVRALNVPTCGCDAALSPDGLTFAYLNYVDGRQDLVLRDLATGAERVIPGTPGYGQCGDLRFTSDSARLVYAEAQGDPSAGPERYNLRLVSLASGEVTPLLSAVEEPSLRVVGWLEGDVVIVTESGSERVNAAGRAHFSPYRYIGRLP